MVFSMPTEREILKYQKHLPDDLRQCAVVLNFAREMPKHQTENFYRIRLSRDMMHTGEGEFWKPELLQPGTSGKQKCMMCGQITKRVGVMSTVCINPFCSNVGRTICNGPKRGVHSIKTEFKMYDPQKKKNVNVSFVVGRDWNTVSFDAWKQVGLHHLKKKGFNTEAIKKDDDKTSDAIKTYMKWEENKLPVDMICGCLVILDRRYSDSCLCAVYRTCGILCDMMAWSLK